MALPQQILQPTFHDLQIRTLQLARLFCSFSSLLLMTGPFLPLKRKKREKKGGGGEGGKRSLVECVEERPRAAVRHPHFSTKEYIIL